MMLYPQCSEIVWLPVPAYHAVIVHFTSDLLDLHLRALDFTRVAGNLYTEFDLFANKRIAERFELTDRQQCHGIWAFPTIHYASQWLKCNGTQRNAVPPPPLYGSKHSPTSECYNAIERHTTIVRGPNLNVAFPHLYFCTLTTYASWSTC